MKITIEQNQVIVNLDELEFPIFEAMAGADLQRTCPTDFVEGTFLNKDYLNLWSEAGEAGRASWLRPCRFEAKGTTGTTGDLASALASGKLQAACLTALAPIRYRVVVGVALNGGAKSTKVIMLDPPASLHKLR